MYTKEYFIKSPARDMFLGLGNNYEYGTSLSDVCLELDKLVCKLNTYDSAPKYVLSRTLYTDVHNNLTSAKFIIRPNIKYNLDVKSLKKTFILVADSNFYRLFIENIVTWFDEYRYYSAMGSNLTKFNNVLSELSSLLNFKLEFGLGEGILDITEEKIQVGLSEETIMNICLLPLFSDDINIRNKYKEEISNYFKECSRPYDILKLKNIFTNDLKIYERKNVNKLIRRVYKRHLDFVRVGVGYISTEDLFAVIEKVALNKNDLLPYLESDYLVTENLEPSKLEKDGNLNYIVWKYILKPFNKSTGVPINKPLKKILEERKVK